MLRGARGSRASGCRRSCESTEVAGAGDQAAGALGVGVARARAGLGRARDVGRRLRARCPSYAARPRGARARLLPRRPRSVARDGRDALGGRLAALAPRRRRLGASRTSARRRGRSAGRRGRRACCSCPYLAGERTPHADPDARGAFVGLSLRHDRGALVRAVLEGVAYGLRDSLELLRELGVRPEVGRVSGGGARSEPLAQIVASVLGLPLERTVAEEGAAYGAALLAGVAAGVSGRRRGCRRCVHVRDAIEPDPEWQRIYADGYERFRALYPGTTTSGGSMTTLEGKAALVTGASRGIGAAVARALAREGVSLGLASRSGDDLGHRRAPSPGTPTSGDPADLERRRRAIRSIASAARHRRRERGRRRLRPVPRARSPSTSRR